MQRGGFSDHSYLIRSSRDPGRRTLGATKSNPFSHLNSRASSPRRARGGGRRGGRETERDTQLSSSPVSTPRYSETLASSSYLSESAGEAPYRQFKIQLGAPRPVTASEVRHELRECEAQRQQYQKELDRALEILEVRILCFSSWL